MKFIEILLLVPLTMAALIPDKDAKIVKQELEINPDGSYNFAHELDNGAYHSEEGKGGISAIGQFGFYSPEGIPFYVSYTADEKGFKAYGNHLPTPPPTPEAILRSLEYIRTHTAQSQ